MLSTGRKIERQVSISPGGWTGKVPTGLDDRASTAPSASSTFWVQEILEQESRMQGANCPPKDGNDGKVTVQSFPKEANHHEPNHCSEANDINQ